MKRMWLALGLIVAVAAVSSGALFLLTGIKNDFDARFDNLYRLVEENDSEAAAEAARQLTDYWMEKHHMLCRIVRHTQLDQITLAVARFEPLALYGECGELAAEITRCKLLLEDIWDSELPTFTNIF